MDDIAGARADRTPGDKCQEMTSVCSHIVLSRFSLVTMFRHPPHFLLSPCHSTLVRNCPRSRANTSSTARWSHLLARAQPSLLIAPAQEGSQAKHLVRAHLSPSIGALASHFSACPSRRGPPCRGRKADTTVPWH